MHKYTRACCAKDSLPSTIDGLPVDKNIDAADGNDSADEDAEHPESDDARSRSNADTDTDMDGQDTDKDVNPTDNQYPRAPSFRCGAVPSTIPLSAFLGDPMNVGGRSAEAKYSQEYVRRLVRTQQDLQALDLHPVLARPAACLLSISSGHAAALGASTMTLFKRIDQFDLDSDVLLPKVRESAAAADESPEARWKQAFKKTMESLPLEVNTKQPSHTVVLEAAFYILTHGVLNISSVRSINVKQGRALLHVARWLQEKMSGTWVKDGLLLPKAVQTPPAKPRLSSTAPIDSAGVPLLMLILTGGAGAGKTTTIMVMEALVDHFLGLESVRKSAPTNTAARLLRGDTVHALYKLPLHSIQGRRGKLSDKVLKRHRQRWKGAGAHVIDEISMLCPPHLYQVDVRARAAT